MQYLILTQTGIGYAKAWSRAMFRLTRPASDIHDETAYLYGWIEHDDGRVALAINGDDQPIHPDCAADEFAAILPLPTAYKQQTEDAINAAKGTRAQVLDLLPAALAPNVKTHDDMEADGWFADE